MSQRKVRSEDELQAPFFPAEWAAYREARERERGRESREKCSPGCQPDPTAARSCNLWWNHQESK